MELPVSFISLMSDIFDKEELNDFLSIYSRERTCALRANTPRITSDELKNILPFTCEDVPWTDDGIYYPSCAEPGKLTLKQTGLLYIQEPGAMYPVNSVCIGKDEKVLDLCASPGGKSLQIASKLSLGGLLVCNDNNPARISALIKNLEQYGVSNAVVYNQEAAVLEEEHKEYFDKVFVDVPCSGEGMFRKDRSIISAYNKTGPYGYIDLQRGILKSAAEMTAPGGCIIYSTCTYNLLENEENIIWFLDHFNNFEPVDIKKRHGIEPGMLGIKEAARLWPHKTQSEGHFVCVLKKDGTPKKQNIGNCETNVAPPEFTGFCENNLTRSVKGFFQTKGKALYYMPQGFDGSIRVKPVKKGVFLGNINKSRFEPSAPFILTLDANDIQRTLDLRYDDIRLERYLRGETLIHRQDNGYTGILCEGRPAGWAKQQEDILKNCYPRSWLRPS